LEEVVFKKPMIAFLKYSWIKQKKKKSHSLLQLVLGVVLNKVKEFL
jgi:hypothetical protein